MELSQTELSELICTRLSHDLIGSIGAVASALELMEEDGGTTDEDTKKIVDFKNIYEVIKESEI